MRLERQAVNSRMAGSGGQNANPFRVTYDPQADAAYVRLAKFGPGEAELQLFVEGVPSRADVILDFSSEGKLLGVEVIGARTVLAPELLELAESVSPPENGPDVRHGESQGDPMTRNDQYDL